MKNRSTTKNVTIEEKTYQVSKMDARSACWLFAFMASRSEKGAILSALGRCTREEFNEIQAMALRGVFFLDNKDGNTFPIAIIAQNGLFVDPELASDPEAVFRLTSEAILFNIEPFLVESKSKSQSQKE